jgi:transcriptional regulator with XRE-family HTH domain
MDGSAIATFGEAVRKRRVAQGLSQEGLASRAGLDRTYVSGIERGVRNPSLRSAERIARALEVPLHDLLAGES